MPILPSTYDSLEQYTNDLLKFIHTPLARQITGGIHVNDALIHGAWEALPQEWTGWWTSLPDHRRAQRDLIDSIDEEPLSRKAHRNEFTDRPESLTTWLETLRSLSLPRRQLPGPQLILPENLTAHMKTKKHDEVAVAAAYIQSTCNDNKIEKIIDIGSGQGYLSLILAAVCNLQVLAIDGSAKQIAGSKATAALLGVDETKLSHLERMVDGTEALAREMSEWAKDEKCMLVGLHACGSLSEHMIRYFARLPFITHLSVAGCCYNHITLASPACPDGFPISDRMREARLELTATALMTGCQAPTNWEDNPGSTYPRRHFYRAVLEKLLFDKGLSSGRSDRLVWGIRTGDLVSFEQYTRRAMSSLSIPDDAVAKEEMVEYEERYKDREGQIAILWTLSVLLCKVVESIIALDRYYYLVESGARDVDVVPMFDYRTSPRNLLILANKSVSENDSCAHG